MVYAPPPGGTLWILKTLGALSLLFVLVSSCLCGCDPVRTVRQSIKIRIVDESGLPATEVYIRMKESWESWNVKGGAVSKAETENSHNRWLEKNWLKGVTDQQGEALLWRESSALDWNKGSTPLPDRDGFSNREYIIRLLQKDVKTDAIVVLKPGLVVRAGSATLAIDAIGTPTYIEALNTKD